jgi:predicted nuclease of predicted toxin-antitoxin system
MRVLLDECLPQRLAHALTGHVVSTVAGVGWAGTKNGHLLARISGNFDAFVTVDKNLPAQQKMTALPFGVIVVRAESNTLQCLLQYVPQLLGALEVILPGQIVVLPPAS